MCREWVCKKAQIEGFSTDKDRFFEPDPGTCPIFSAQDVVNSRRMVNIMPELVFYATKSVIFVKMLEEEVNAI